MKLEFQYDMNCSFSNPVQNHYYSLKCLPFDTDRQHIVRLELDISPKQKHLTTCDCFGNQIIYGIISQPHNYFNVSLRGIAETGLAVNEHYSPKESLIELYKAESKYTKAHSSLKEFFYKINREMPAYDKVLYFMTEVYETFSYETGVTTTKTTAEQAFLKQRGVCQDYSHILIALLRLAGIPARYVVGMMIGEGASHAWVEAYCKGYWYGVDPTNNLLVDDRYIKLSHGRDFADCIVSRGIFNNFTAQHQSVMVTVKEQTND